MRRVAGLVQAHRASNRPVTADRILRVWHTVFVALSPLLVLLEVEPAAGQVQRVRPVERGLVQLAQLEELVQVQPVAEPAVGQVQRVRRAERVLAQLAQLEELVQVQRVLELAPELVQAQRVLELAPERVQAQRVPEPPVLGNRRQPAASLQLQNRSRSGKSRARNNFLLAGKANPLLIRERVFY